MLRPNWTEYFMEMTHLAAKRSTCLRRRVGAVIVKDNNVLATGYNGAPSGLEHCHEQGGCLRDELGVPSGQRHEICRALHAEQNAIIQAAKHGTSIKGATIYITTAPCAICAKMLINAGITKVVFDEGYPDTMAEGFLVAAGVEYISLQKGAK